MHVFTTLFVPQLTGKSKTSISTESPSIHPQPHPRCRCLMLKYWPLGPLFLVPVLNTHDTPSSHWRPSITPPEESYGNQLDGIEEPGEDNPLQGGGPRPSGAKLISVGRDEVGGAHRQLVLLIIYGSEQFLKSGTGKGIQETYDGLQSARRDQRKRDNVSIFKDVVPLERIMR